MTKLPTHLTGRKHLPPWFKYLQKGSAWPGEVHHPREWHTPKDTTPSPPAREHQGNLPPYKCHSRTFQTPYQIRAPSGRNRTKTAENSNPVRGTWKVQ